MVKSRKDDLGPRYRSLALWQSKLLSFEEDTLATVEHWLSSSPWAQRWHCSAAGVQVAFWIAFWILFSLCQHFRQAPRTAVPLRSSSLIQLPAGARH